MQRGEIRKLTDAAYDHFIEEINSFEGNREKAEIISWLEDKGCSEGMAADAYENWGADTAGIVNTDCYRLAELPGVVHRHVGMALHGVGRAPGILGRHTDAGSYLCSFGLAHNARYAALVRVVALLHGAARSKVTHGAAARYLFLEAAHDSENQLCVRKVEAVAVVAHHERGWREVGPHSRERAVLAVLAGCAGRAVVAVGAVLAGVYLPLPRRRAVGRLCLRA